MEYAHQDHEVKQRYLAGSTYTPGRLRRHGGSQTPGLKKRADTCRLTPVAGMPRKFWSQSKSYKHKKYEAYCQFMDKVN